MKKSERFTKGEEIANAVSHGMGLIFATTATMLMVSVSSCKGSSWHVVSAVVYGVSMMILYLSSTMNHALQPGKAKDFFHNFDQIAIFLLIAGTYTPMALVAIRGNWGWTMFGIEWGLAFVGIMLKIFIPNKFEKGVNTFYVIAYAVMGWLFVFFLNPLSENIAKAGMNLIFIGGAFYTGGILFFKLEKIKYSHLIWHLMVIGGSVFHWAAIYFYILQ